MSSYLAVGAVGDAGVDEMYLVHWMTPQAKGPPPKFTGIATLEDAKNYAAMGFHVSVDKGLATAGEIRKNWALAAKHYTAAYQSAALVNKPVPVVKAVIAKANNYADEAKRLTKKPGRSGKPRATEPVPGTDIPVAKTSDLFSGLEGALGKNWWIMPAGISIYLIWQRFKGSKGKSRRRRRR